MTDTGDWGKINLMLSMGLRRMEGLSVPININTGLCLPPELNISHEA